MHSRRSRNIFMSFGHGSCYPKCIIRSIDESLNTYDFEERCREKQASRDEDARQLASGEITRDELWKRNTFLSAEHFKIDLRRAKKLY